MTESIQFEKLAMRLQNAWLRKLSATHAYFLRKLGLNEPTQVRMRPRLCLYRSQSDWGYWRETDNTIGLNLKMFEICPWTTVIGVLGHETGHQAVVFLSPSALSQEGAHGPTFQAFCRALGVDPVFARPGVDEMTARTPPNPFGPRPELEPDPILVKVQKLLALSASTSPAEAEAALAAANRLMAKRNIELAQESQNLATSGFERRLIPWGSARVSTTLALISNILSECFFVEVIIVDHYDHLANRQVKALELLGRPVNLVMAEQVFYFLSERCETLWAYHQPLAKDLGESGQGAKNAFVESLLLSFLLKMRKAASQAPKNDDSLSSAVIALNDPGLADYVRQCHPQVSARVRTRTRRVYDQAPFSRQAGTRAGQALSARRPLSQDAGRTRLVAGLLERGKGQRASSSAKPDHDEAKVP
ncbi:MAG: DUF2786 domain-containing protein [Deltaproteobacteria bacterium]|jgi:hypothetical protein|nr:DUF2786 domain-containing protein [Deltaproteobacteria bacterium]